MNILDEANDVIQKNTVKPRQNEVTQEFVVRVLVKTPNNDPAVVRDLLDKAAIKLSDVAFLNDSGNVSIIQVEPK